MREYAAQLERGLPFDQKLGWVHRMAEISI